MTNIPATRRRLSRSLSLWERPGASREPSRTVGVPCSQSEIPGTLWVPKSAIIRACAALLITLAALPAHAVNITVSNTTNGNKTPEIVGYNSGHFLPNSNTASWWKYSNVNGARVWPTPTTVEFTDDISPWGDGVSSEPTFVARRAALRANPLSPTYINWSY